MKTSVIPWDILQMSGSQQYAASDSGTAMLINIYSIYYFTLPKSHFLKVNLTGSYPELYFLLIQFLA